MSFTGPIRLEEQSLNPSGVVCPWGQPDEANYETVANFGQPFFTAADEQTTEPAQDRCSLTTTGCLKRFGTGAMLFEGFSKPVGGNC